jgi:hypothetical protein
MFTLDTVSYEWTRVRSASDQPPPLADHTATLVHRDDSAIIYTLGGISFYEVNGADSSTWKNDLYMFDTTTNQWSHAVYKDDFAMSRRQGHTATLIGDKIYVFGGFSDAGMASSELWTLSVNPDADGTYEWSVLTTSGLNPTPRQGHVAGLILKRFYIILGGYGVGQQTLNDFHVLDIMSEKADGADGPIWEIPVVEMQTERGHGAWEGMSLTSLQEPVPGQAISQEMMIVGGCTFPSKSCSSGDKIISVLGAEDIKGKPTWRWKDVKWETGHDELPRFGLTTTLLPAQTDNTLLTFGGCVLDKICYNTTTRFSIAHSAPRIKDIAKEIVKIEHEAQRAKPKIPKEAPEDMATIGQHFIPLGEEESEEVAEADPEVQDALTEVNKAKEEGPKAVKAALARIKKEHPEAVAAAKAAAVPAPAPAPAPAPEQLPEISPPIVPKAPVPAPAFDGIMCPLDCSGHGLCMEKQCDCDMKPDKSTGYYGAGCEFFVDQCVIEADAPVTGTTPQGKLHVLAKDRRMRVATTLPNGAPEPLKVMVPVASWKVPLTSSVAQPNGTLWAERVYLYDAEGAQGGLELRARARPLIMMELSLPAIKGDQMLSVKSTSKVVTGSILLLGYVDPDPLTGDKKKGVLVRVLKVRNDEKNAATIITLTHPLTDDHRNGAQVFLTALAPPPLPLPLVCDPVQRSVAEKAFICDCHAPGGLCVRHDDEGIAPTCSCYEGWAGPRCSRVVCPQNCTHEIFGKCKGEVQQEDTGSQCKCNYGYEGPGCGKHAGCGDLGRKCGANSQCVETTFTVMTRDEGTTIDVVTGECRCNAGWAGARCDTPVCLHNCTGELNGKCVPDKTGRTRHCECNHPFTSLDCSRSEFCPGNCSHHGLCNTAEGKCDCDPGWLGASCDTLSKCGAFGRCGGNGHCLSGKCACLPGWTGPSCMKPVTCPLDCSNAGVCHLGKCHCQMGRTGPDCASMDSRFCPLNCSGHGSCNLGKCFCLPGFIGQACEDMVPCPTSGPDKKPCGGHGICKYGRCFCSPSYGGAACKPLKPCPMADNGRECAGRGICVDGTCFCSPGQHGETCQRGSVCLHNCSRNGFCFNGRCMCDIGFGGEDCSVPEKCPTSSKGHSVQAASEAVDEKEVGEASAAKKEESDITALLQLGHQSRSLVRHRAKPAANSSHHESACTGHGRCIRGACYCEPGFSGPACDDERPCPDLCHLHGKCQGNVCFCDQGFRGVDCTERIECPADCHGHGVCYLGTCACHPGFVGRACENHVPCPNDCTGRGDCVGGQCICDNDYSGADCSRGGRLSHICEPLFEGGSRNCSGHGLCSNGKCVCNIGWEGGDCSHEIKCPSNCSGHGLCWHGDCYCDPGFEGTTCHVQRDCPVATRVMGGPASQVDWESFGMSIPGLGKDGGDGSACTGHGVCSYGRCFCVDGWAGDSCETNAMVLEQLKRSNESCAIGAFDKQCSGHGECDGGQCDCGEGWYGEDCGQNTAEGKCPNKCSGRGVCGREGALKGKCMCQSGWAGADCSKRSQTQLSQLLAACVRKCSIHGACVAGDCQCSAGWEGERCDLMTCPNLCTIRDDGSANGDCIHGRCICNAGFGGDDCSIECPNQCSGHGTCHRTSVLVNSSTIDALRDDGYKKEAVEDSRILKRNRYNCFCQPGYTAEDCSLIATLVDTVEAGSGATGDVGARHAEQTSLASSFILVAIATFGVGLCAFPAIRAIMERRNNQISQQIMNKQGSMEAYIW